MTIHFDLLTVPQSGQITTAAHLTDAQAAHVRADWKQFGSERIGETAGHWTIAFAHFIEGEQRVTSTLRIPRTVADDRAASLRRHPSTTA